MSGANETAVCAWWCGQGGELCGQTEHTCYSRLGEPCACSHACAALKGKSRAPRHAAPPPSEPAPLTRTRCDHRKGGNLLTCKQCKSDELLDEAARLIRKAPLNYNGSRPSEERAVDEWDIKRGAWLDRYEKARKP